MADVVVLTQDELDRLRRFLGGAPPMVVITTREALEEAGLTETEARAWVDRYDCGGSADTWIDFADSREAYFFEWLRELRAQQGYRQTEQPGRE